MHRAIWIIGGCVAAREAACLSSIEVIDDDGRCKKAPATLQTPRRGAVAGYFPDHRKIIIAGGCSAPGNHTSDAEIIDPTSGHSKMVSIAGNGFEQGFSCAAACMTRRGGLLVAGGYDGIRSLDTAAIGTLDGPDGPFYVIRRPRLPLHVKNAAAVDFGNKIWLIGGWDEKVTLSSIFTTDVPAGEFECTSVLPYPVEGHTATVTPAGIVVAGGWDGVDCRRTLLLIDQDGDVSVLPVELEIARENHSTVYDEQKKLLYVIGGWDGRQALDSIECFLISDSQPYIERIPTQARLNEARQRAVAVSVQDVN